MINSMCHRINMIGCKIHFAQQQSVLCIIKAYYIPYNWNFDYLGVLHEMECSIELIRIFLNLCNHLVSTAIHIYGKLTIFIPDCSLSHIIDQRDCFILLCNYRAIYHLIKKSISQHVFANYTLPKKNIQCQEQLLNFSTQASQAKQLE